MAHSNGWQVERKMNNDKGISRRAVMLGSALLPALGMASAQTSKTVVISSANGERAGRGHIHFVQKPGWNVLAFPLGKVVHPRNVVAAFQQQTNRVRANIAGAAGHENS